MSTLRSQVHLAHSQIFSLPTEISPSCTDIFNCGFLSGQKGIPGLACLCFKTIAPAFSWFPCTQKNSTKNRRKNTLAPKQIIEQFAVGVDVPRCVAASVRSTFRASTAHIRMTIFVKTAQNEIARNRTRLKFMLLSGCQDLEKFGTVGCKN